jgi:hypothetical protein
MYHINHEGEVKKCRAFIRPCPYSKDKHFRTQFEAMQEATELRTAYEFKIKSILQELKMLDKYYEETERDYQDLNIVKEEVKNIVGNKPGMNRHYREVVCNLLGDEIGNPISTSKGIVKYFKDNNRSFLLNNFDEVEAEAISDVSRIMDSTEAFRDPSKKYSVYYDEVQRRMRNTKEMIEACHELGISIDTYNFEYVVGDDHPFEFFNSVTVDENGEINNLYYLGLEGQNFHTEPSKVTKIENNLLYTENHPEGLFLPLTYQERNRPVQDTARAIFFRDKNAKGTHVDFANNKFWNTNPIEWDSEVDDTDSDLKWGIDKNYDYHDSNQLKDFSTIMKRKDMQGKDSFTFTKSAVLPNMTKAEAIEDANRRLKEAREEWPF